MADQDERYVAVREIARGGMGRVSEAIDTRLERAVAIKEALATDPAARARFEREVAITARLEHPSIVPLYDAGTLADGTPFYVMRKVSGEPLDARIRDAASLDARLQLLPHLLAAADAVAHAHARGVIHRDLKPSNILVGELGETIVIDWGLAKLLVDDRGDRDDRDAHHPRPAALPTAIHTDAGTVVGTPGFMAPEQLAGDDVDARADVYALGACLYHVLAGQPPLDDRAPLAIPADLTAIIDKAMAPSRTARYLDAGGLSEDLRRFLGGQLVAAHRYPVSARLARWVRRHRALVSAIALSLVALAALGIVSIRRIVAETARAEAALARERARADDLIVAQAASHATADPTLAATSLAQLPADSPRWATLGPQLADLRARGVAQRYPGAGRGTSIDLAHDRVLASGFGAAWLHDLTARTSTLLARSPEVVRARWCGPLIIIERTDGDTILDPRTGARSPAPWPRDRKALAPAADGTAIYLDTDVPYVVDLIRGTPPVALPLIADSIERSPSGRWLIAGRGPHLELLRDLEPFLAFDAPSGTAAFDAGERRVALGATTVVELALEPALPPLRTFSAPPGALRYFGGSLVVWQSDGRITPLAGALRPTTFRGRIPQAELAGRVATLVDERQIALAGDTEQYMLRAPHDVDAIAAHGRFLVAAGPAGVVAWDVSELVSDRTPAAAGDQLAFAGADLLATRPWIAGDPPDDTRPLYRLGTDLAPTVLPPAARALAFSDGTIVALDDAAHTATILDPPRAIELAGITAISSADRLIAGTATGALHTIDRATGRPLAALAQLPAAITSLAARAGWIAAHDDAGNLWRRDPLDRTMRAATPAGRGLALGPDGTVYLGRGRDVIAWPVTGAPFAIATGLAEPAVRAAGASWIAIATADGGLHVLDRTTGTLRTALAESSALAVSDAGVAAGAVDGGISIVDLASSVSIRLIDRLAIRPHGLALSPDGRLVVAAEPRGHAATLHTWRLDVLDRAWLLRATTPRDFRP